MAEWCQSDKDIVIIPGSAIERSCPAQCGYPYGTHVETAYPVTLLLSIVFLQSDVKLLEVRLELWAGG